MSDTTSQPSWAPLLNDDLPPEDVNPDTYTVYLASGHSMEAHKATVGHKINVFLVLDKLYTDNLVYGAQAMSQEVLEAVRKDRGLEFVERDGKARPA